MKVVCAFLPFSILDKPHSLRELEVLVFPARHEVGVPFSLTARVYHS